MNLGKLKNYLNLFSLQQAAVSIRDRFFAPEHEEVPYERWLEHTRISSRGYAKISKEVFHFQPTIGVYAHAEGRDRAAFVQSLSLQTYRNVRPLKDCPEAEYTLFAGPGCTLTPDMLSSCVRLLNEDNGGYVDLVYFDSDCIDAEGRKTNPAFRPEYDPILLRKVNYMGNVFLVRTALFRKVYGEMERDSGGKVSLDSDGVHAFLKRLCKGEHVRPGQERSGTVRHLPRILYHEVLENARKVSVDRHIPLLKKDLELVSVIIPNKDHVRDLKSCIDSLLEVNAYHNLEIIIVENNSSSPEIFQYYEEIQKRDERIHVYTYTGSFNYSRINNFGASKAHGRFLLFLNNDTVILKPSSIWYLASHAERQDVGAVGALLIYPDHTVQHAGVILGYGGIAGHAYQGEELGELPGEYPELLFEHTRNVSAVTGACMLMRREVYEQAGGFDEELAVTFNDVDLCLRLRQEGYRILICPNAELIHNESASRGAEDSEEKVRRFHREIGIFVRRWEKELEAGDPFYNPNLTLTGRTYTCKDPVREARAPYLKYLRME